MHLLCFHVHAPQAADPRAFRNSQNGLGLLAVPIEVMKEQIAERVRISDLANKTKITFKGKSVSIAFSSQRHRQVVEESQKLTELMNRCVMFY